MTASIVTYHPARTGVMRRAALACILVVLPALLTCHNVNLTAPPLAPARPVVAAAVEVDDTCTASVSTANDTMTVAVRLAWGDGDTTAWLADSTGDSVAAAHVWYWSAAFVVRAQARNQWGVLSEWSEPCTVSVTGLPPFADSLLGCAPVGSEALKIAVTPDGTRCYVMSDWENNDSVTFVRVVRLADMVVIDSIAVPGVCSAICCSPDGEHIYVGWYGMRSAAAGVVKVSTQNDLIVASTGQDDAPDALAVTPDNSQVWAVSNEGGRLVALATADLTTIDTIYVVTGPVGVAFDSAGAFAYVAHDDARVSVIDVASRKRVNSISLDGGETWDVEYSSALNRIYVTLDSDSCNYVSIDPARQVVDFSLYDYVTVFQWLAAARDGQWLYIGTEEYEFVAVARPGESHIRSYITVTDSIEGWLATNDLATLPDCKLVVLDETGTLRLYGPSLGVGAALTPRALARRAAR